MIFSFSNFTQNLSDDAEEDEEEHAEGRESKNNN